MESSFKKGYDKTINADGSFELSFKSRRVSPALGFLLTVFLLPSSCAVSYPLVGGSFGNRAWQIDATTWMVVTFIVYCVSLAFIINQFCFTRDQIVVRPNVGLVVSGKNLPFKEIDQIGTIDYVGASSNKAAFVYANTQGTQVKLSRQISLPLAEAVATEIRQASGLTWK